MESWVTYDTRQLGYYVMGFVCSLDGRRGGQGRGTFDYADGSRKQLMIAGNVKTLIYHLMNTSLHLRHVK